MTGFKMATSDNQEVKFEFYIETAPVTSNAFLSKSLLKTSARYEQMND